MAILDLTQSLLKYSPSTWSRKHRLIKSSSGKLEQYRFDGYEFLKEIHDNLEPRLVVMKAAQLGFTETLLNRVLHLVDTWGLDVLYVLPDQGGAGDFSSGRFKVAFDGSPRLQELFSNVDNVHHKRAGAANLYIRGSHSRAGLKSIPCAGLFLDEFDEMNSANVQLARDRVKGQERSWEVIISTPSLPGHGIDAEYQLSDKRVYEVPCPHCGEFTAFDFDTIERGKDEKVSVGCLSCKGRILGEERKPLVANGRWRPTREARTPGYWISGLYSPTQSWEEILHEHERAKAHADPRVLREWMNGTLGVPFVEKGYTLDIDVVRSHSERAGFKRGQGSPSTMVAGGVDAGVRGHYLSIVSIEEDGKEKVLHQEKVQSFHDVHAGLSKFGATAVVIDAQPNTEASRKLQKILWDNDISAWLCYYSKNMKGRVKWDYHAADGPQVIANRTEWVSEMMGRIATGQTLIPYDSRMESFDHLRALRRVVEANRDGNLETNWENDGPDHFAHSINYARIALEQVEQSTQDIEDDEGGYADEFGDWW